VAQRRRTARDERRGGVCGGAALWCRAHAVPEDHAAGDFDHGCRVLPRELWQKLTAAGKTNIDFVGTERSVSCSDAVAANFDQDNEGHSCYSFRTSSTWG